MELRESLLDLYKTLDEITNTHFAIHKKQAPCAKGCSSCCSQYFEISEGEFAYMKERINQYPLEEQKKLEKKSLTWISLFKENWPNFYSEFFSDTDKPFDLDLYYKHPERFNIHLPCIFLSKEGSCEIYEHRPIVCRTTGVGFQYSLNHGPICNEIRSAFFARFWQADLRPYRGLIDDLRWFEEKRQFPIFYYVYQYFK